MEINAVGFCTIDKKNEPHSIAVASVKVFQNNIVISNINIKESINNIDKNNNVAIVVWNKEWETACIGFELKGKAKNYTFGKWFDFVKKMPENKGYDVKSAIVVKIEKIKKLIS